MIKNTHKKYNQQGGLNGIWVAIEEANYLEQRELEMHRRHAEINHRYSNGIVNNYYNYQKIDNDILDNKSTNGDLNQMCRFVVFKKELEDSFSFLKAHSDTPENLELAKEVLRLKNISLK